MSLVVVVSPACDEGESKDQDRVALSLDFDGSEALVAAAICDGVSSSPNADVAATLIADRIDRLFEDDGLPGICDSLRGLRIKLVASDVVLKHNQEHSRLMLEEVVRRKREGSYQSTATVVKCRLAEDEMALRWLSCGDSAFFVFTPEGVLLKTNIQIQDADDRIVHASPLTEALPDSYDSRRHVFTQERVPLTSEILLCSDGLYDGFASFRDIFNWLQENQLKLCSKNESLVREIVAERHAVLRGRQGNDDISFIWLRLNDKDRTAIYCHDFSASMAAIRGTLPQSPATAVRDEGAVEAGRNALKETNGSSCFVRRIRNLARAIRNAVSLKPSNGRRSR